jgi:GPN-loop GTPase
VIRRDYKVEYEKLREQKAGEQKRTEEEKLEQAKKMSHGSEIPMNSLITQVSSGREISDIYLKHPGNESSDDEEGTEENCVDAAQEENFVNFVEAQQSMKGKVEPL